jgi:serine protease Do
LDSGERAFPHPELRALQKPIEYRPMIRTLIAVAMVTGVLFGQRPSKLPDFDRRTPVVIAVENVGPAVVNIRAQARVQAQHMFWGLYQRPSEDDPMYADASLGSGVVVHPDGYVITNEHVTHGADRVLVKFQDGREVPASPINASTDSDVALLKVDDPGPWPTAELGDSSNLLVGETAIALGNPFGLSSSATTGILSATGRSVRFQGREVFQDFLQTSALINPGNSGGPLLDINGRVIGINIAIDSRGQGIGFAIPINRVKEVMTDLVNPEIIKGAWIGFEPRLKGGRLVAVRLVEDGPGAHAGVQEGDAILAVDGRPVASPFEFHAALLRRDPNDTVAVTLDRRGRRSEARVRFEALPLGALAKTTNTLRVLGMECAEMTRAVAKTLRLPSSVTGPVVVEVERTGTAASIGLRPGDVIVQIGNAGIRNLQQLQMALGYARRWLGPVSIRIYREREGLMRGTIEW